MLPESGNLPSTGGSKCSATNADIARKIAGSKAQFLDDGGNIGCSGQLGALAYNSSSISI